MYTIKNNEQIVTKKAKIADSFLLRAKGLMFSRSMDDFECLWIKPCNSIHTFFMNFNIDVVFVSKDLKVSKVIKELKPWRMTRMYLNAHSVLEFPGGYLGSSISEGDQLDICIN